MSDHNYSRPCEEDPSNDPRDHSTVVDTLDAWMAFDRGDMTNVLDTLETWVNFSASYRARSIAESTAKNVRL